MASGVRRMAPSARDVWIASHRGDRAETPKTGTLGPGGGCAGGWLRLHTHTRTRWCNFEFWAVRHGVLMRCKVQKRRGIHFLTPRGSGAVLEVEVPSTSKLAPCLPSRLRYQLPEASMSPARQVQWVYLRHGTFPHTQLCRCRGRRAGGSAFSYLARPAPALLPS
jgi:hypothetical protein